MNTADSNRALIETFYRAFQRRDGAAMASCYHANATFHDPVFTLEGERIGGVWKMLCSRGEDLRVEFADAAADVSGGSTEWQAWYTFKTTGRLVHNIIDARFKFTDGLIAGRIDDFDFWRWSRQALGATGWLLGWSALLRNKVRTQAARTLDQYLAPK